MSLYHRLLPPDAGESALRACLGQRLDFSPHISVILSQTDSASDGPSYNLRLGLEPDGAGGRSELSASLRFDALTFDMPNGDTLDLWELSDLPGGLRDKMLRMVIERVLSTLPFRVWISHIERAAPRVEDSLTLRADFAAPMQLSVSISMPDADWHDLTTDLMRNANPATPATEDLLSTLPFSLHYAFCRFHMQRRTLRDLSVGDVILPPSESVAPQLFGTGLRILLSPDPDGGHFIEEITMTSDLDTPATEIDLDRLPVEITIVAARRRISFAELSQLTEGGALDLDLHPSEPGLPVEVTANGVTVAEGHIIDIDGRDAVQITTMLLKQDD